MTLDMPHTRVTIIGASGRVGTLVLSRALAAGRDVSILSRSPRSDTPPGVRVVSGDIRDPAAVTEAITGAAAVISALGARANTVADADALETGMGNVVAAMTGAGVLRLVTLSGAAVNAPDDQKPGIDRIATRLVRVFARHGRCQAA